MRKSNCTMNFKENLSIINLVFSHMYLILRYLCQIVNNTVITQCLILMAHTFTENLNTATFLCSTIIHHFHFNYLFYHFIVNHFIYIYKSHDQGETSSLFHSHRPLYRPLPSSLCHLEMHGVKLSLAVHHEGLSKAHCGCEML